MVETDKKHLITEEEAAPLAQSTEAVNETPQAESVSPTSNKEESVKPKEEKTPKAKKKNAAKPKEQKKVAASKEKRAKPKKAAPKKEAPKKKVTRPRKKRVLTPLQIKKQEAIRGYKRYEKVRKRYYGFLRRSNKNSKPTTDLYNILANKRAEVSGTTRHEVKKFNKDFIEQIERVIPSLETIVVSPHKFINEFAEIVQVEKARKITPRAVKFMAQNVQHISEVLDGGRIVPKKVLNVYVDDDLKIYENRFIMTLVKRLQVFIELRYKYIQEHGDTKNSDQISIKKEVKIGDTVFEFEGNIKMSVPSDDEGARESNNDLLERLALIRKRTSFLVNSPFMKEMAKAVPVADPIQQTNIIRLNYAYQDAYKLWMFINRYDELGISYTTTQAKVNFDEAYMERLDQLTMSAFLALETEHANIQPRDIKQKVIKPVIKPGQLDYDISDERFLEGGLPVVIKSRQETAEQKEARLKREAAREKARLKKEAARQKARERAALKKAREKERAAKRKEAERERARLRKEEAKRRQEEKNLERARKRAEKERIKAERRAYQAKLQDEARRLRLARQEVAKLAAKEKKEDGK